MKLLFVITIMTLSGCDSGNQKSDSPREKMNSITTVIEDGVAWVGKFEDGRNTCYLRRAQGISCVVRNGR